MQIKYYIFINTTYSDLLHMKKSTVHVLNDTGEEFFTFWAINSVTGDANQDFGRIVIQFDSLNRRHLCERIFLTRCKILLVNSGQGEGEKKMWLSNLGKTPRET